MRQPVLVAQYLDVEETTIVEWPDNIYVDGPFNSGRKTREYLLIVGILPIHKE
jgi:hypothetical protein